MTDAIPFAWWPEPCGWSPELTATGEISYALGVEELLFMGEGERWVFGLLNPTGQVTMPQGAMVFRPPGGHERRGGRRGAGLHRQLMAVAPRSTAEALAFVERRPG